MTELWPPEPSRNPKGSSAQVEWHQGQIWELKDGRVIRTRNYSNPADASNPPSCGSRQSTCRLLNSHVLRRAQAVIGGLHGCVPRLRPSPRRAILRTAMSVENVASFQRAVEATNRGDVAGVLRELDPAVEFQNTFEEAFGGRGVDYRGHDGIRDFFHDFVETLAEFRFDSTNVQDLGDQLLAVGHIRGRDNQDGRKIELSVCVLCDFADGKIVRVLTYFDPVDSPEGPPNILESTGRRN